jgi:hypothetical protein
MIEFQKKFLEKAGVELWQPDFAIIDNPKFTQANSDA